MLSITAALGIFSPSGKIILLCLFPFWGPFAGIYYVIKWAWPVLRLLKPIFLALGRLLKWIWNFVVRPAFHLILLPFKLCGWALRRIIPAKRFVVRSFHNFAKRQHHKALLRKIGSSRERLLSGLANPDAETSEGKESFELDDVDADLQNAFEGSLIELLRRRRILQGIVENSHFSDLYNLSRTSKDIRDSLLPLQQKQSVVTFFRHKSCASGSKSPCWCCGIQICPVCFFFTQTTSITDHNFHRYVARIAIFRFLRQRPTYISASLNVQNVTSKTLVERRQSTAIVCSPES